MVKDPICGMDVDETTALSVERAGRSYYFCSSSCRDKFLVAAESSKGGDAWKSSRASVAYVCPMCAGIEREAPGECPKCGMRLEPKTPRLSEGTVYTCPMHPEVQQRLRDPFSRFHS